ncbi:ArsR/SmtB family transcription factor [Pseudonocardia sp. CA-142604]|uniref:ArsR/SmtB family transcription factor n=1 Tax=Pseudonocardia sp. CA-142604 TaxID=3240024 RepID=UPI003D91DF59
MSYGPVVIGADLDLAATARAIAEPPRAAMLLRLMDGQAHTARDLAEAAGISPPAASPHLRHLVDAGLVSVTVTGRRRLHAIASPEVATAIEALAAISPLLPVESLREAHAGSRLQTARVCYSHLGGSLAVALARRITADGVVDAMDTNGGGTVGTLDHPLLAELSIIDLSGFTGPMVRGCMDWTERQAHLAGRLGTALLVAMLEHGWLLRRPGDRALNISAAGTGHLTKLGIWPLDAIAETTSTG